MKKVLSLILCIVMIFTMTGCAAISSIGQEIGQFFEDLFDQFGGGSKPPALSPDQVRWGKNYHVENTLANQDYLYGMGYLAFEGIDQNIDYVKAYELLDGMGVRSVRNWMHFSYLMEDPTTFKAGAAEKMHAILQETTAYGMQVIGMNHTNWNLAEQKFVIGKHEYQPYDGSAYYEWLAAYEQSWYTLVKEFPEVTYWEIDNELNNMDFMFIHGAAKDKRGRNLILSLEQMAKIAADMLFYASRGIHAANPNAVTVLGGLVDPNGLGTKGCGYSYENPEEWVETGTMADFLNALYDAIDSGEHNSFFYDDFFQVAAWHPYYYTSCVDDFFVEENNKIYEVIKTREGKDKKVFLTEMGWDPKSTFRKNLKDYHITLEDIADWIPKLYETVSEEMPYVESVHYFRMFDNIADNNNTAGLFFDPDDSYDAVTWIPEVGKAGAAKITALAYQKAAGGTADLNILETDRPNKPSTPQTDPDKLKWGENYDVANTKADQSKLYGIGYIAWEGIGQKIDFVGAYKLLHNLGAKSTRNWMHFKYLMEDPYTFKEGAAEKMHEILLEADSYNIQIIGMNHTNWDIHTNKWVGGKHEYQPWTGSDYYKWLEVYEDSWYTLVKEFPEVTYWEIDNEINNMDFMYIQSAPKDSRGRNLILSLEQMAQISADMMFYASRGIHRANPKAITVMGGLVDPNGLGTKGCGYSYDNPSLWVNTGNMAEFLEVLYDCIDSGKHGSKFADDFFQVAAWHPYYYGKPADDFFVAENNKIYEVIKRREGKDKKVFLTEFGWNPKANVAGTNRNITLEELSEWIPNLYTTIRQKMPYVESLHYFRMFDNIADNNHTYGLFFDPDPNDSYSEVTWIPKIGNAGAPKLTAYAYQKAAGGKGDLTILEKPRNK